MVEEMKSRMPWMIAGGAAIVIMLAMTGFRAASGPEGTPDLFTAKCAACEHESTIAEKMVKHLGYARMHPEHFRERFGDAESPLGQQCAGCGVFHSDYSLASCPRTGKRFVLLRDAETPMPVGADALAAVSPF